MKEQQQKLKLEQRQKLQLQVPEVDLTRHLIPQRPRSSPEGEEELDQIRIQLMKYLKNLSKIIKQKLKVL